VGDGERDVSHAHALGDLGCPTVELDGWAATRLTHDLNLEPADAMADTCTQSFRTSFLGGKTGCQTLCGIAFTQAIRLLGRGVDAIQEALTKPLNGLLDSGDLDEVDAATDDHVEYQAITLEAQTGS